MKEIVFAQTRHWYDSYYDIRELVKLSGFEQCFIDEIDFNRDAVYVISPINGEFRPMVDNRRDQPKKATLIEWCLERPQSNMDAFHGGKAQMCEDYLLDGVWYGDKWLAEQAGGTFVPIGGHPDYGLPTERKVFDLIHLSYVWGRRETLMVPLKEFSIAPNGWGLRRHNKIRHSRFMLNIHQDDDLILEPLRFIIAASYGIPIISEECHNSFPYLPHQDYVVAPYGQLVETVKRVLAGDYEPHRERAEKLREKMTGEYSFRSNVERAVECL